jgi:hypothetical protein
MQQPMQASAAMQAGGYNMGMMQAQRQAGMMGGGMGPQQQQQLLMQQQQQLQQLQQNQQHLNMQQQHLQQQQPVSNNGVMDVMRKGQAAIGARVAVIRAGGQQWQAQVMNVTGQGIHVAYGPGPNQQEMLHPQMTGIRVVAVGQ